MKADKVKHRAYVNPTLDLLLKNVGGSTSTKQRPALLINLLLAQLVRAFQWYPKGPGFNTRQGQLLTKSQDRIAQNPLVGESISSKRLNPAWDRFPTPLSVVRPVSP